jgi:hypothetical protein
MFVNKCDRDRRHKVDTLIMTLPKKDENGALSVNGRCDMMFVNQSNRPRSNSRCPTGDSPKEE